MVEVRYSKWWYEERPAAGVKSLAVKCSCIPRWMYSGVDKSRAHLDYKGVAFGCLLSRIRKFE